MNHINNTIKSVIIVGTLMFSTSITHAKPISLGGLDMTMSVEQQKDYLTRAGFKCEEKANLFGLKVLSCKNGKKTVTPSKDDIRYNCHTFNVCNLTLKELAQNLLNEGFVKQMEYKPRFITDFEGKKVLIEKFCGRGEDGEVLCVEADKNLFGQILLTVILERGRLGQGSVSFD